PGSRSRDSDRQMAGRNRVRSPSSQQSAPRPANAAPTVRRNAANPGDGRPDPPSPIADGGWRIGQTLPLPQKSAVSRSDRDTRGARAREDRPATRTKAPSILPSPEET